MIANLDLAIPNEAVRVAAQYAFNDPAEGVRSEAMKVLAKYPGEGTSVLERIVKTGDMQDSQLATLNLGREVKSVLVRMSDIDDDGHLSLNGHELLMIGLPPNVGSDSGWKDIAGSLVPGQNTVEFLLHNGPYGGWSGRLRISAGIFQYDSTKLSSPTCPCDADAFSITVIITLGPNGQMESLAAQPPHLFPANFAKPK